MVYQERSNDASGRSPGIVLNLFCFGGYTHWGFALLSALVGTTLPFWLRPPGFSFKWGAAIEFLAATILFHAGFSLLYAWFDSRSTTDRLTFSVPLAGSACIIAVCLVGLHLNNGLVLHASVPRSIFIVYGISALFVGALYALPPFSFHQRGTGEVVLSIGLGLVPILGAYLIQVGDITRRVYLAGLPVVAVTGLWVWTSELASRINDERRGRKTMVMLFPPHISGRYAILLLTVSIYVTLALAIFVRSSLHPFSLAALLTLPLAVRILTISWRSYADTAIMLRIRGYAFMLHFLVCCIIAASSLISFLQSHDGGVR